MNAPKFELRCEDSSDEDSEDDISDENISVAREDETPASISNGNHKHIPH